MILSIETATELCGAALVRNGESIAARIVAEKNIHSERLMVLVDEILREANTSVKDLRGVAVSIGPGSFTGLRIGLSAAKGLAYAQSLPLLPVPTLDGIAEQAVRMNAAREGDIVCALVDAKRDEAYFAFYEIQLPPPGDGPAELEAMTNLLGSYSIAAVEAIADDAKRRMAQSRGSGRVIFAGDGVRKIVRHTAGLKHTVLAETVICDPVAIGVIAERKFAQLSTESYEELEPAYIRDFVTTQPRVANQTAIT